MKWAKDCKEKLYASLLQRRAHLKYYICFWFSRDKQYLTKSFTIKNNLWKKWKYFVINTVNYGSFKLVFFIQTLSRQARFYLLSVIHPSIHPFIYLFVCLFNKHLLSAYYMPGSVPHSGDAVVEKKTVIVEWTVSLVYIQYTCVSGHLIGLGVCLNDDKYIVKEKNWAKKEMQGMYYRSRNKQTKLLTVFSRR